MKELQLHQRKRRDSKQRERERESQKGLSSRGKRLLVCVQRNRKESSGVESWRAEYWEREGATKKSLRKQIASGASFQPVSVKGGSGGEEEVVSSVEDKDEGHGKG